MSILLLQITPHTLRVSEIYRLYGINNRIVIKLTVHMFVPAVKRSFRSVVCPLNRPFAVCPGATLCVRQPTQLLQKSCYAFTLQTYYPDTAPVFAKTHPL